MLVNSVWNFGDSWAAGFGIDFKHSYAQHLANRLSVPCINYAEAGSGIGQVVFTLLEQSKQFAPNDLILITIPPDVRWYRYTPSHSDTDFTTLEFSHSDQYNKFLSSMNNLMDPRFFAWHVGLFITYVVNFCERQGLHLLMQHNYGSLSGIPDVFDIQNYKNYIADPDSSMWDWLDIPAWTDNFDPGVGDGPPLYTELAGSESPYMIPGDNHPNELGHKIIYRKLYEVLQQRMG